MFLHKLIKELVNQLKDNNYEEKIKSRELL